MADRICKRCLSKVRENKDPQLSTSHPFFCDHCQQQKRLCETYEDEYVYLMFCKAYSDEERFSKDDHKGFLGVFRTLDEAFECLKTEYANLKKELVAVSGPCGLDGLYEIVKERSHDCEKNLEHDYASALISLRPKKMTEETLRLSYEKYWLMEVRKFYFGQWRFVGMAKNTGGGYDGCLIDRTDWENYGN